MSELNFSSNADEIRYYLKKLLADRKEHNRKEITNYIRRTPNGHTFTEGMITGALKGLVDNERDSYENTRRGWYRSKKPSGTLNNESIVDIDPLTKRVKSILNETVIKLKEACTFNLLDLPKINQSKINEISNLIKKINEFENEFEQKN